MVYYYPVLFCTFYTTEIIDGNVKNVLRYKLNPFLPSDPRWDLIRDHQKNSYERREYESVDKKKLS